MSSNLSEVKRCFEEGEMKRIGQWPWCNSMHEFCLPSSLMWYVFGCESEVSDLTPDKSSSAAASECITEPTAGAKSIFIWVQLMSLQLSTQVSPPRHWTWVFFLFSTWMCTQVSACWHVTVNMSICVCLWVNGRINPHNMAPGIDQSHAALSCL